MPQCSRCGRYLFGAQHDCPHCAAPPRDSEWHSLDSALSEREGAHGVPEPTVEGPLVAIARLHNAAEAGYFAHELTDTQGIAVNVRIEESFDALSGRWAHRYLLCVPEAHGRTAAVALQQLVQQTEADDDEFAPASAPVHTATAMHGHDTLAASRDDASREVVFPEGTATIAGSDSGVNWVPIVLTLAAGSAALWGARQLHEAPKANAPPAPVGGRPIDLWDRLAHPPRPWIQPHENGRGLRQLRIDSERGIAVIREDANGDGVFETEIEIHRRR